MLLSTQSFMKAKRVNVIVKVHDWFFFKKKTNFMVPHESLGLKYVYSGCQTCLYGYHLVLKLF